MATFTGTTKTMSDLTENSGYNLTDLVPIHDGNGLKSAQAKNLFAQHMLGTIEPDASAASQDYEIGDSLILEGVFYRVIADIAEGDELVADTNIEETTVGKLIAPLNFENSGFHNSIYRGKSLGTSLTSAQQAAISAGTFDDLFIGDYWTIDSIVWRIAAFDYWYGMGDTACSTHHVVIIPDSNLLAADGSTTYYMNTSAITTGAYVGSGFYSGTNADSSTNTAKADCLAMAQSAFGSGHILTHREHLANTVTSGYESAGSWYDSDLELPSEEMVYGCREFKNVMNGTNVPANYTISNSQLPLFRLDHRRICNRANWWLRDVVSASLFALVNANGYCSCSGASNTLVGVRPVFAIC